MSLTTGHRPVLLDEVLAALALRPGAKVVDATFGAGGYSRAFLAAGAHVLALDRDPSATRFAPTPWERGHERFSLRTRPFAELGAAVADHGWTHCDAIAFDVGVSSMQLDEAERGFSFMRDGPLDMRMGDDGPTAADIVNTAEPADLGRLLRRYGEEAQARRIVGALVRRREAKPFTHTLDLAETIEQALGGRRGAPTHPATRTFQALRIAVNDELGQLEAGLRAAESVLAPGGRMAIVTFHSLEDRIAKTFLAERAGRTPSASRHAPPAPDAAPPSFRLLHAGAHAPSPAEIGANPRARSAKLRAAERTMAPAWDGTGDAA